MKFKIPPHSRHPMLFDIPVLPRHWCVSTHVIFPFEIHPSILSPCQIIFTLQVVWFKNDNTRLSTSDEIYIEDSKVILVFATQLANKLAAKEKSLWGVYVIFLTRFLHRTENLAWR